ncbi:MAG: mechanosensitive ion channel domain-containing protein [Methyloligellaceae bacterium]
MIITPGRTYLRSGTFILPALLLALVLVAIPGQPLSAQTANGKDGSGGWVNSVIASGANPEIINKYSSKLNVWQTDILRLKTRIGSPEFAQSNQQQPTIDTLQIIISELRKFSSELKPELDSSSLRLQRLGPAPKEGEPESDTLASQRTLIRDEVAAYSGLTKRAEVLLLRADQIIAVYNAKRRQEFLSRLLSRSQNFGDGNFWTQTLPNSVREMGRITDWTAGWIGKKLRQSWLLFITTLFVAGAAGLALFVLSYRLLRSVGTRTLGPDDDYTRSERGAAILRRTLSVSLPIVGMFAVFQLVSSSFELLTATEFEFSRQFLLLISVAVFLLSAFRYSFIPRDRGEQLFRLHETSSRWLFRLASLYVMVWLVDHVLQLIEHTTLASLALGISRSLFFAIIYSIILGSLLLVRLIRPDAGALSRQTYGWPRWIYGVVALFAFVIFAAALLGYVTLAHFIGSQIVTTGGLLFLLSLVHLMAEYLSTPKKNFSEDAEQDEDAHPPMINATQGVVLGIGLDLLVLLIGIPLLLLQWGYEWSEVRSWISSAFFGFQIGAFNLSLQSVFLAIGTFIAGLMLTRTVRRMFERRTEYVFADDTGTQDSIAKILTYLGFALTILVALSFVGLGLSNLVLIAGALSIGIGFGLQSIVNNFVSGLILLTERPIKKGDWIILNEVEGFVEQIKVRSTEIRTFDRSSVIIPNADLITGRVTNWTYGNKTGRVVVDVGVAYDSDPERVFELLMEIARSQPKALRNPQPRCLFSDFADSALIFSLRVYIANVEDTFEVRTSVRNAIWKKFREEGIEIAFPQRDLHIKDGGGLRDLFGKSSSPS